MPIVHGGCNKCGGDVYFQIDEEGQERWHCIQCGHDQKTPRGKMKAETLEIRPQTPAKKKAKRPYTKGEKFYERYPWLKRGQVDIVGKKPPEYWQGYRQAVLDGAPRMVAE